MLEDRYTWWVLGNSIGGGYVPFWINVKSDANIHVFEAGNGRSNLLANLAENMDHVPPQWNVVNSKDEYPFICEIGQAEDPGDYAGSDDYESKVKID